MTSATVPFAFPSGNYKMGKCFSIKVVHILVIFLIVICSMAQALEGGGGGPSVRNNGKSYIHEGLTQPSTTFDHVSWEYFLQKYSSSGKGLTSEELARMVKSMQKCQKGDNIVNPRSVQKNEPATLGLRDDLSKDAKSEAAQLPNCNNMLDSILTVGKVSSVTSTAYYDQSSFGQICQRLLFYIENPECCATNEKSLITPEQGTESVLSSTIPGSKNALKKEKPSSAEVWGYGFLLVTIISCSSLVGVSLMPFMAKDFYKHLLTVMIGLAVGSLTGSAVFHLLPQALRLADHDPNHDYLHLCLVIVGGIWLFFMVERILKFIMDYKKRNEENWKREKMSSVLTGTPESSTIAVMTENGNVMKGVMEVNGEQRNSLMFPSAPRDTGVIYECQEQVIKASFGHQEKPRLSSCHDHQVTFEQGKDSVIATVAWMIIFGDGLHNFIDGLSIGAAFNESIWTGVSISVAVLCEELPHELGDFAVLLNAGMSMKQAVIYNFLSACTCYIGMAVGILLGEIEASRYIFALAGGMFLYISLVDMVPEMNEIAQETSKISVKKGLITLLLQNVGLFMGVTALYLLAFYQDSIQF